MTKKLTHDEAREILLNGGKVDGYFSNNKPAPHNPLRFDDIRLTLLDCKGDARFFNYFAYFIEHKETEEFECWINVYHDAACGHTTREKADKYAFDDRIACIKITGKEGDGL